MRVRFSMAWFFTLCIFVACAAPRPSSTPAVQILSLPATDTATATTSPTATPTETQTPTLTVTPTTTVTHTTSIARASDIPDASVSVRTTEIKIAAYPFEKFLRPARDDTYNFSFSALDRKAYDHAVSAQNLTMHTLRAVILENEFLRLTFLPELGGRLWQITYKPTNQNLLYNNRVLKPTMWGPLNQSGWLAIGGMEWALPVNEHGYEWGTPWPYTLTQNADGATITLRDTDATDRVRAQIRITLPAHAAYIIVHPRIENPTAAPTRVQFWINAQLVLDANKNISPNTEFILPTDTVFVHSTGNQFIPSANMPSDDARRAVAPIAWPQVSERDLSRYANWEDFLGVFATHLAHPFVGAYNHDTELGIARVFPSPQVPGVKLFAFGPHYCCRTQFTDDDSDYFELWGGLPRTFFPDDDVTLDAGKTRTWNEYWVPFVKTDGMSVATRDAVLFVTNENGNARVRAYSAIARRGTLLLQREGNEVRRWEIALAPTTLFSETVPLAAGHLQLRWLASDGNIIAETPR